jgi:hypothetical protein
MLQNLLLLLSIAVGEIMVMVHVEAIIVTTLITTARVYKRTELPSISRAGERIANGGRRRPCFLTVLTIEVVAV